VRAAVSLFCLAVGCMPARADDRGRALFEPCRACHALDPAARVMAGPNLGGLIGRRIGGDPGFDYSPVLKQAAAEHRVWTIEALERFLADPERMFSGMWMSLQPMADAAERDALARFLADPEAH
jgi:cytochrome c